MDREVVIVPYRDGPYLVRGPVSMRDQRGTLINLARNPIALCRCGKSQTRPFCDGTHRAINFHAPSELEREPTSGFQDEAHQADGTAHATRQPDARRSTNGHRHEPAAAAVAHAALTRAARAAAMMTDGAGQDARSLIAGALALLDGAAPSGEHLASLVLIAGALRELQPSIDDGGGRVVAELRVATNALTASS